MKSGRVEVSSLRCLPTLVKSMKSQANLGSGVSSITYELCILRQLYVTFVRLSFVFSNMGIIEVLNS